MRGRTANHPHRKSLRDQSFGDRDLSNADLHGADLRGADFRNANLRGANLREARTGLHRKWGALMVSAAFALSVVCGVGAGYAGRILHHAVTSEEPRLQFIGVLVASCLVLFLLVATVRGLRPAILRVLPPIVVLLLIAAVVAVVTGTGTGMGALAAIAFLMAVGAVVVLAAFARAAAGVAGTLMFAIAAVSGALVGGVLRGGVTAAVIAISAVIIGKRALGKGTGYPTIVDLTTKLACRGGTSFRGADLTGADFSGASLLACDFRGARLEGARFDDADVRLCLFDGEPPAQAAGPPRGPLDERAMKPS
jgi:hypothetical protein